MGRVPIQKLIITWLKLACCIRDLEKCKFYSARELYDIYNASTPNTTVNKSYQIRSFCLQLNKIVNNNMITNLKSKYNREDGYKYIFVNDNEIDCEVNEIRVSNRRRNLPNMPSTTPSTTPSRSTSSTQLRLSASSSTPSSAPYSAPYSTTSSTASGRGPRVSRTGCYLFYYYFGNVASSINSLLLCWRRRGYEGFVTPHAGPSRKTT